MKIINMCKQITNILLGDIKILPSLKETQNGEAHPKITLSKH